MIYKESKCRRISFWTPVTHFVIIWIKTVLIGNIFLNVPPKKESCKGLNDISASKWWQNFQFWVNCPFKSSTA